MTTRLGAIVAMWLTFQPGPTLAQGATRFEDFPVPTPLAARMTAAFVDNRLPLETAAQFNERIRAAAADGPNFAGHFVIVSWHCGSSCTAMVIVDAVTRQILSAPIEVVSLPMPGHEEPDLSYRLDSRLLLATGFTNSAPAKPTYGTRFYVWNGRSLKLIRSTVDEEYTREIRKLQSQNRR